VRRDRYGSYRLHQRTWKAQYGGYSVASQVNPNAFPDNAMIDKSALREQFEITAAEITALQQNTSIIRKMAFDDNAFDQL